MAGERILDGLNDEQRRAVTHDAGPLLIVAGAGTGKTTVITRRIAWLIAQKKARPEEILALTFTDKAAAEMEERVDTLVQYGYADVEISTFHAFGDRLLREHALEIGLQPDFRVLNRAEQVIFFRDRLFEFPLAHYRPLGDPARHIRAIMTLISRCKDEDISPEEYQAYVEQVAAEVPTADDYEEARERIAEQRELAATYAKYQELMAREGCVDFGDQIVLVMKLLRARANVRANLQRRFKYVMVDEFQDTNHAQFELVKLLGARHGNVGCVCDDDQAIYRWRGAAISNVLAFLDRYPEARQVVLTENYRSHQKVLDAAYRLIVNNNPDRLEVRSGISKHLVAVHEPEGPAPAHPQGHPVDVLGELRALRPARDQAADRVPARARPHRRVGEPALSGLVGSLSGAGRRPHALLDPRGPAARLSVRRLPQDRDDSRAPQRDHRGGARGHPAPRPRSRALHGARPRDADR